MFVVYPMQYEVTKSLFRGSELSSITGVILCPNCGEFHTHGIGVRGEFAGRCTSLCAPDDPKKDYYIVCLPGVLEDLWRALASEDWESV